MLITADIIIFGFLFAIYYLNNFDKKYLITKNSGIAKIITKPNFIVIHIIVNKNPMSFNNIKPHNIANTIEQNVFNIIENLIQFIT